MLSILYNGKVFHNFSLTSTNFALKEENNGGYFIDIYQNCQETIHCGYLLESSYQGDCGVNSNKYLQHMIIWRNGENYS